MSPTWLRQECCLSDVCPQQGTADCSWLQFVGPVQSNLVYYIREQGVDTLEEVIALKSAYRIRDFIRPAMQEYVSLHKSKEN